MKNIALVQRLRSRPPIAGEPVARRPFRLWMTGSLAVVMAGFVPVRGLAEETQAVQRVMRHSRYSVNETVLRIEAAARLAGLSVLVRMGGDRPAIVLASSVGGTLVVMDEASSRIDMPLSVHLRQTGDGGVDVSIAAARDLSETRWDQLLPAVADDLAALPGLLERALG